MSIVLPAEPLLEAALVLLVLLLLLLLEPQAATASAATARAPADIALRNLMGPPILTQRVAVGTHPNGARA